jgi:glycosyltransferase involved in cell wall biosynthesis/ubiquinone/menaquinone biosynthesis C-methylase UbiE/Tfp pilus assembly protein PilF
VLSQQSLKIGYILRQFPILSETFVINEIITLQSLDVDIYPISLFPPEQCQKALMSKCINETFNLATIDQTQVASNSPFFAKAGQLVDKFELSGRYAVLATCVADYIREKKIQLLHAHFATESALVAMLASELTGVPFTFTAHAYDIFVHNSGAPGETLENRLKSLVKNAAHIISISEFNKKYILDKTGDEFSNKIDVIHCGIDTDRFKLVNRKSSDRVTLICVGRFVEKKGYEFLLRAFGKTISSLGNSRLRLLGDGPLKPAMVELCKELGLEDKVDFLGAAPSEVVTKEMEKADIFVLHSITAENGDMEGIPVSIMEAMASGLAVISTRHSGIPELVSDDITGFLTEEKDIDKLAQIIADVAASPKKRKKMGLSGRKMINDNFNLNTECLKLSNIFANVVSTPYRYMLGADQQQMSDVGKESIILEHPKAQHEMSFWRERKSIEGKLNNGHYHYFYTTHYNLDDKFYTDKKILDIGCGPRGSLEWANMAERRVGLDPLADSYKELGTDSQGMEYIASGSEDIPFPDAYFDVVTSFNSIDHVDDIDKTITEIKRVLKPGGTFLLLTHVNHKPTICEPVSFSWDVVDKFTDQMTVCNVMQYESAGASNIYEDIKNNNAYNHQDTRSRYGVLTTRLIKGGCHSVAIDWSNLVKYFSYGNIDIAGSNGLPFVSIIIPAYNAETTIALCLDSLIALDYPNERYEIILVDNGSTDLTLKIACSYNITIIREPSIKSSYAARNAGIKAAQGEFIAFTDADCIVTPGWLSHLVSYWDDSDIGCFAGEIEAYKPEELIEKFSDREGILRQKGTLSCRYLPYTQTANSAYRKTVFDQVGLFVPEMTSGGDADLAWRMQKILGLKIKFIPDALVYHKHRTSIEGLFNQFKKYEHGKLFWRETYPDYQLPSVEQRKRELDGCVERVISNLAANTDKFIKEQIDFVELLTPFLKYVMSLGTHKARYEIESNILSSAPPLISVVIPTYNRAPLLKTSLYSLTLQTVPLSQFEVVVIDDGSNDSTRELCEEFSNKLRLVYRHIENSGISAAKNMGISLSSAPLIFFFDDDDIAHQQLLEEHLKTHKEYPDDGVAVLGYTTWSSTLTTTGLMHYLTEIGQHLFSYPKIKHGQILGYKHFWGGRSSCKKSFLVEHGIFRPEFRFGSEDIELGYRLDRFGLKVVYNQNAVSYMNRPLTFDEFCRRCEKQGKSQYIFSREHPDPIILQYCMVNDIERKWADTEPVLKQRVEETRNLEALAGQSQSQDPTIIKKLHSHYACCFEAYKIKGIFEAMRQENADKTLVQENVLHQSSSIGSLTHRLQHDHEQNQFNVPTGNLSQRSILIIAKELPFYDRSSGNFRLFEIIRIMATQGHSITFLARPSFREINDTPYIRELEQLGVTVHKISDENEFLAGNKNQDSLGALLSTTAFDVAYLMFYSVAELYLERIKIHSPRTQIIVDSVDIHFLREQRQNSIVSVERKIENESNKIKELNVYRKADLVVVLTDVDRQALLTEAPQIKTVVIPNIHPTIPTSHSGFTSRSDIVFVGGFTHEPNIDAVEYLCSQIWPLVAPLLPESRLIIAGNAPPPRVTRFASERIIVTGYIQDLPALLDQCRISVAPLRFGAGMKGKVGEALAFGLPVVGTSIAAEGMGLVHGKHLLIADNPSETANCLVDLYQDDELWRQLSVNGKSFIEQNFSPMAVAGMIQKMLSKLFTTRLASVLDLLVECAAESGVITSVNTSFPVPGRCNICGSPSGLEIRLGDEETADLSGVTWVDALRNRSNLRENIGCCSCSSTSRHRALVNVLLGTLNRGAILSNIPADSKICIFESSGMASYNNVLASKFSYINTSYDKVIIESGTYDPRCYADLQKMPYGDNTFDYIITGDVMEHVRDYFSAIEECFRVLKPGGFMLFTVPYKHSMGKNHIKVLPDGDHDVFLEEAEYNGTDRSPVYRIYGRELLDELSRKGFSVERRVIESEEFGFVPTEVFVCQRPNMMPAASHLYGKKAMTGNNLAITVPGMNFAIKMGAPDRTQKHWGDIYYAECLAKALERAGNRCRIDYLCEWGSDDLDIDVVIHLKGLSEYKPKPYNINIMWMLNHPSLHTKEELERYDAVLVASLPHARKLKKELKVPVYPFLQATDPEHFRPYPDSSKQFDLLFVGNNVGAERLEMRKIVADLLPTPYRLAVWGQGWEGKLPPGVLQGDFIPWQDLPRAYASANIVLNDHQPEMKEYGFVNNRTFDAVACGAVVLSDYVAEMEQVLEVNSYTSRDELYSLVMRLLSSRANNSKDAENNRRKVLGEFTFERRVEELMPILKKMLTARERVRSMASRASSFMTFEQPLVSVLMSTYNRKRFLPAAIESIKAQTYTNWELVLVNDGGEKVSDVVRKAGSNRIRLLNLERNCGKGHAINCAFLESKGAFIAHLDDDDIWYPDHLERLMLPLLTIPGLRMAYSDAYDVWLKENGSGEYQEERRELRYYRQVTIENLLAQNHIQGMSVVHDRELLQEAGFMDENLKVLIDWDLWRRMSSITYPYHVSRITSEHNLRENRNTTGDGQITNLAKTDPARYMANCLRVVNKQLPLPAGSPVAALLSQTRLRKRSHLLIRLGERHEQRNRPDRAEIFYQRAVRVNPEEKIPQHLLIRLGERYEQQDCPDRAEIIYQRAVSAYPEMDIPHRLLGLLALKSGRFEEAADCFNRCLEINASNTADFLYASLACIKAGRGEEALSLLDAMEREMELKGNTKNIIVDYRRQALQLLNYPPERNLPLEKPALQITPRVSIIIPLFNKVEYTKQCLEALITNTPASPDFEIILIDNASSDGTRDFLNTLSDNVTIIPNRDNLGFARACNQGARLAMGEFVLFLNNDTIPKPGWLEPLVEGIERDGADICGARLLYPNGKVQHAGVAFGEQGIGYHIFNNFDANDPAVSKKRFMQCVTAACMIVRKELFNDLRGFDEGYVNGFEDVDFCLRAGEIGKKILYVPESTLIHFEETSEGRKSHDDQNGRRFLARWGGRVYCDDNDFYRQEGFAKVILPDGKLALTTTQEPLSTEILVEKGMGLKRAHSYEEALELFSAARKLGNESVLAHMGDCLANLGKMDEAAAAYSDALKTGKCEEVAHTGMGVLNLMAGKHSAAAICFNKALKIDPDNSRALCGLGIARSVQGRPSEGFELFRMSLDKSPDNLTALHELIKTAYELDRLSEAESYLVGYLMYHPADSNILFSLAGLRYRLGKNVEALDSLERVLAFEPAYEGGEDLADQIRFELDGCEMSYSWPSMYNRPEGRLIMYSESRNQ